MNKNTQKREPRSKSFLPGALMVIVFLGVIIWLIVSNSGTLKWAEVVFMYICIGLVSGMVFWIFTKSTGDFTMQEMGIKLTGGAGIGACFIVLLNWLFPVPTNNKVVVIPYGEFRVIQLKEDTNNQITSLNWPERRQIVVEFLSDSDSETLKADGMDQNGDISTITIVVDREGFYEIE